MVDLSHDHVAEHEHTVGRGNHLVPPLHDGFVHLVGVAEGPTRVDDDVGVAEVEIGGDPAFHVRAIIPVRRGGPVAQFGHVQG